MGKIHMCMPVHMCAYVHSTISFFLNYGLKHVFTSRHAES